MMRAFVTEVWGIIYGGAALGLGEHWKLDPDEAREHTQRSIDLINSLDKKQLDKLEKKFGKYIPATLLFSTVSQAVGARVVTSLAMTKQRKPVPSSPPNLTVSRGPVPPTQPPSPAPIRATERKFADSDIEPPVPSVASVDRTTHRGARKTGGVPGGAIATPLAAPDGAALTRDAFNVLFESHEPGAV